MDQKELNKIKNQTESYITLSNLDMLTVSQELSMGELYGNINLVNEELNNYLTVNSKSILAMANLVINKNNSGTLYYEKH